MTVNKGTDNPQDSYRERDVRLFFTGLASSYEVAEAVEAEYCPLVAPDFNVFDYISPDENKLSDIMRDMLDPGGTHGQGRAFLDLFIDLVVKPEDVHREYLESSVVTVSREVTTRLGRIDILLSFGYPGGEFGIVIENKPWAYEQEEQLDRYRRYAERRFGGAFILVFLGGDVDEPTSMPKAEAKRLKNEGRLKVAWYCQELKDWLRHSQSTCRNDHVRDFVADFHLYVEAEFEGDADEPREEDPQEVHS